MTPPRLSDQADTEPRRKRDPIWPFVAIALFVWVVIAFAFDHQFADADHSPFSRAFASGLIAAPFAVLMLLVIWLRVWSIGFAARRREAAMRDRGNV